MDSTENTEDFELKRILESVSGCAADLLFRQRLLEQTTRVIRRRRRFRTGGLLVGMAACYLAGLVTMRLIMADRSARDPGRVESVQPDAVASVDSQVSTPAEGSKENFTNSNLPVPVLERLAELEPDDTFRDMYREAGDRYMNETGDVAAALRCYRLALRFAPPQSLVIQESDTWLFASLKQARLQEYQHATNGG